MELVLLYSAENDLQKAFDRYESYREGLGEVFLEYADLGLVQITRFPKAAPLYSDRYRRQLITRFPYGIFYTVYPTRVVVTAVVDLTQHPDRIAERLR